MAVILDVTKTIYISWNIENLQDCDWGAGFFTSMAVECLLHLDPIIHTVDIVSNPIERCKIITADVNGCLRYRVAASVDFLKECAPYNF